MVIISSGGVSVGEADPGPGLAEQARAEPVEPATPRPWASPFYPGTSMRETPGTCLPGKALPPTLVTFPAIPVRTLPAASAWRGSTEHWALPCRPALPWSKPGNSAMNTCARACTTAR